MFTLNHSEFMDLVAGIWAMLDYNDYLTYFLSFLCIVGIAMIVYRMIRPAEEGGADDG